jgi:NAD(P)-dependent dehydrogenase (short-subunit alcohol dehydrogenase family)
VVVGAGALGMAVARRLALGHRILLADIDGVAAEDRAATMRVEGCDAAAVACDVTSPDSVAGLARTVAERGGLGALVYVAGLSPSAAGFHAIIRVNLTGAARICEALLPLAGEGSAAVLISSLAAHSYQPAPEVAALLRDASAEDLANRLATAMGEQAVPQLAYPVSKWGMNLYARRHAVAWGKRGARIVSLSPGLIATPMGALEFEKSPGKRAMYEKSPLKRECTMLEIADVAEFLVSPRASFISGTDVLVDGGLHAALTES